MNSYIYSPSVAFHHHIPISSNYYSCLAKEEGCTRGKYSFHSKFSERYQHTFSSRRRDTLRYFTAIDDENNDDRPVHNIGKSSNDHDDEHDDEDFLNFDDEALLEELMSLSDGFDDDVNLIDINNDLEELERMFGEHDETDKTNFIRGNVEKEERIETTKEKTQMKPQSSTSSPTALEEALLQGVVPAGAGVGSNCLPGDFGFDPFGLSTKDYFKQTQNFLLNLLPSNESNENEDVGGAALPLSTKASAPLYDDSERPPALILRDYREAEIRHGRLAMLAAILWPLQEITDRLFIPESFGHTTFVYGGTTLPFISLFMMLTMLLLGYLDIYAASIKDSESGDAFLPGECFWDPLSMLDGAPDAMKRKMQERELNNGRMAMIAVLSYILQEAIFHEPVINLPWNQILFEPAFEIPEVQAWLDGQFAGGTLKSIDVNNNIDLPVGKIVDGTEIIDIGEDEKASIIDAINGVSKDIE